MDKRNIPCQKSSGKFNGKRKTKGTRPDGSIKYIGRTHLVGGGLKGEMEAREGTGDRVGNSALERLEVSWESHPDSVLILRKDNSIAVKDQKKNERKVLDPQKRTETSVDSFSESNTDDEKRKGPYGGAGK